MPERTRDRACAQAHRHGLGIATAGKQNCRVEIAEVYDRDGASAVILRSIEEYRATDGALETAVGKLRRAFIAAGE
jgi:hypothetical protein